MRNLQTEKENPGHLVKIKSLPSEFWYVSRIYGIQIDISVIWKCMDWVPAARELLDRANIHNSMHAEED